MRSQYTIPARDAPHPFDQRSADVTLCTSDSVQFHVHTLILSKVSPVFATMFELPQPLTSQQPDDDAVSPVRSVVYVTEDSKALEPLLRLCYPVSKAELHHLDEIQPALEGAIKYDMEWPTEVFTARLLECAAQGPLQVWAFGCCHGLEHVARGGAEALRASLPRGEREKLSFLPDIPQSLQVLDGISAGQYFRLLQFVHSGGGDESATTGRASPNTVRTGSTLTEATRTIGDSDGFALLRPPKAATMPVEAASAIANQTVFKNLPFADVTRIPFIGHPSEDVPSPDIICRYEDGTKFKAHQSILSLSPVLKAQIAMMNTARASSQPPQPPEEFATALPVLDLGGPSGAISTLLGIYYHVRPQSKPPGRRSSDCIELLAVATKYKIQPAVDLASAQWESLAPAHPHHSYFLARKRGMRDAAAVAATAALRWRWRPEAWATPWLTTMEDAPAGTYHQLFVYLDACSRAALQAVEKTTKVWELTAAQRLTGAEQPGAEPEAAARMYQAVTYGLNRQREGLERREVSPKADLVRVLRRYSYSSVAGPPSLRNKYKDDLESLLESLPREIDEAINKVKLDLR